MNAITIVVLIELLVCAVMVFFATKIGRYWFRLWRIKILAKNRPGTMYLVVEDENFRAGNRIDPSPLMPSIELARAWCEIRQFERSYKRVVYRLIEVREISWPDEAPAPPAIAEETAQP